ncbi:hypothetical protein O181_028737 [Austropuccinia psidii MF-1]|uniref:Uncharacterized protein n=1 Tax=Austropuccinia psidii MF-1 TaxID=1389203 RepID=A0A9Q3CSI0_9BASI|nr:hypothetical protein [Austropuccinia psidii MF-1]
MCVTLMHPLQGAAGFTCATHKLTCHLKSGLDLLWTPCACVTLRHPHPLIANAARHEGITLFFPLCMYHTYATLALCSGLHPCHLQIINLAHAKLIHSLAGEVTHPSSTSRLVEGPLQYVHVERGGSCVTFINLWLVEGGSDGETTGKM